MAKKHKTRKSVMAHQFSRVPKAEIQRSSFDRSHGYKTTLDSGYLYPIFCDEVLPGDSFNLHLTAFARMATPIFPIMDNMRMETFFFFVPTRLVWDNWQKFNGEQENPGDSTDFVIPTLGSEGSVLNFNQGSIHDYFGLPTQVDMPGNTISELLFCCYNLIYNEWFRDQNLQDSMLVNKGDNAAPAGTYEIKRRGKRHDYFTSALPWPQKPDPVSIPLGGSAPIVGLGVSSNTVAIGNAGETFKDSKNNSAIWDPYFSSQNVPLVIRGEGDPLNAQPYVYADLANASTVTINSLREAFQIQRLLERDARSGTRYIEVIRSHFGVSSPDARLQRPKYLGGDSSPVNISPVASTVPTDISAETPQGNLAAVGTVSVNNHGFSKSFTEHGYIIGLINIRADLTYQQGLNRLWSRQTRFDFYWPALAHLGEQAVLNKEIYAQGTAEDDEVFGYQERYAEYRYKPSMITGKMRSNATESLDAWHLSQDFGSLPVLGDTFIQDNPPIDRVIAVPSEPQFIFDGYFKLRCARPMPLFGVPGLIDHF